MSFQNAAITAITPPPADYFKQPVQRGHAAFEVSSSMLKEFARCPARWRAGYESPDSKSKDFGSLLDCLMLTPFDFNKHYAIRPSTYKDEKGVEKDWHHASNTCKAWLKDHSGLEVISREFYEEARAAAVNIAADPVLFDFLSDCDRQVWVSGQWKDSETGLVLPVKCLIDLVPRAKTEFYKFMGDLKSARNAALIPWQRHVFDMGYHIQAAFNLDLYRAACPKEDRVNFCHIVVENYAPWQTGKRILSESFLELGRAEYRRALALYAQSLKTGKFPGYDDTDESAAGWSITEPTPWMEQSAMFAPRFKAGNPANEVEPELDGEVTP